MIRRANPQQDAEAIAEIYNYYIEHTVITFEEELLSPSEIASRMKSVLEKYDYLVYEDENGIQGYAYASTWRNRNAYRFTAEATVYLRHGFQGKGLGKKLYKELLDNLKQKQFHVIIGGIALPNEKSVRLHESLGFTKVAHFREAGRKFDKWIDVGFWEIML